MSKLILTVVMSCAVFAGSSLSVRSQTERLVWVFVTDSYGRPLPNISISAVEWGKPVITTNSGKAGVPVSGKSRVGDLIHLIIASKYYATVTGGTLAIRISSLNQPGEPIPISLKKAPTALSSQAAVTRSVILLSNSNSSAFQKGLRALRGQRFIEAFEQLSKAYERRRESYETNRNKRTERDYADVNRELGATLIMLNRMSEAVEKLQEAVRLNTRDDDSKFLLGVCGLNTGDMSTAEQMFQTMISRSPSDESRVVGQLYLAKIYALFGKLDDANLLFETALTQASKKAYVENPEISRLFKLIAEAESQTLRDQPTPSYAFYSISLATIIFHKARLALAAKQYGVFDFETNMILEELANVMPAWKQTEEIAILNRLISNERRLLGQDHLFLGIALFKLARSEERMDKYDEAERYYTEAISIVEKSLGKDNYLAGIMHGALAGTNDMQGKIEQGESHWRKARAVLCQSGTNMSPMLCGGVLSGFSDHYERRKQYAEAINLLREAIDIGEKMWAGKDAEGTATILGELYKLMGLYGKLGDIRQLLVLTEESQRIREMGVSPKQSSVNFAGTLAVRLNGSRCYYQAYDDFIKYPKAKSLLEAAQRTARYVDSRDRDVIEMQYRLARIYVYEERYAEAAGLIKQALNANESALQPNRQVSAALLDLQAGISYLQDKPDEAEKGFKQAANTNAIALGNNHQDLALYLVDLARVQLTQKEYSEAEKNLRRALEVRENGDMNVCPELDSVTIVVQLANLYVDAERYADADTAFQQALKAIGESSLADYADSVSILGDYAQCLRKMGREADAVKMEKHAQEIKAKKSEQE